MHPFHAISYAPTSYYKISITSLPQPSVPPSLPCLPFSLPPSSDYPASPGIIVTHKLPPPPVDSSWHFLDFFYPLKPFLHEKQQKCDYISDYFLGKIIHLRNILVYVFCWKMAKKMVPKATFSNKKVLLCHTKHAFYVYKIKWIDFGSMSYCDVLFVSFIISLHGNVNNWKLIILY